MAQDVNSLLKGVNMRRPNKPHVDGYEDEEDCEGYYDPDEKAKRAEFLRRLRELY